MNKENLRKERTQSVVMTSRTDYFGRVVSNLNFDKAESYLEQNSGSISPEHYGHIKSGIYSREPLSQEDVSQIRRMVDAAVRISCRVSPN